MVAGPGDSLLDQQPAQLLTGVGRVDGHLLQMCGAVHLRNQQVARGDAGEVRRSGDERSPLSDEGPKLINRGGLVLGHQGHPDLREKPSGEPLDLA